MVHGSPREPVWEYLLSTVSASANIDYFQSPYCLVGHSHVPLVFKYNETGNCSINMLSENIGLALGQSRLVINPGSVGQPRDGDPRASYAIYNSEVKIARLYRVAYDISATQHRMVELNLPMRLVARLNYGT